MIAKLYQKNIIEKPKLILFFLIVALLGFGYFSKDFRLDASADTLLIEGDPELKYLREITERYGSKDFLISSFVIEKTFSFSFNGKSNVGRWAISVFKQRFMGWLI